MRDSEQYTAKYFRDNHPVKKNKKSSWLVRVCYRKLSFYATAFAYKIGLYANMVSFIGLIMAFVAAGLFIIPNKVCNIIAVGVCFVWIIGDCVDGNLARLVEKQPYGEFIDACGSYTLVAFILPAIGLAAYRTGNSVLLHNSAWIVFLGGIAGLCDCMARLYFQKYKNEKMIMEGIKNEQSAVAGDEGINRLYGIYMRLSKEIGLTGLFVPFLLVSVLFGWLDVFTIFYFLFYGLNFASTVVLLIKITGCLKK